MNIQKKSQLNLGLNQWGTKFLTHAKKLQIFSVNMRDIYEVGTL